MKACGTTLTPPVPIWKKTQVVHPVRIPKNDGDGFSASAEVLADAWCNADGEIFLPGDVSEQIEEWRRFMGFQFGHAESKTRRRSAE
jgi:hypothetical protein